MLASIFVVSYLDLLEKAITKY